LVRRIRGSVFHGPDRDSAIRGPLALRSRAARDHHSWIAFHQPIKALMVAAGERQQAVPRHRSQDFRSRQIENFRDHFDATANSSPFSKIEVVVSSLGLVVDRADVCCGSLDRTRTTRRRQAPRSAADRASRFDREGREFAPLALALSLGALMCSLDRIPFFLPTKVLPAVGLRVPAPRRYRVPRRESILQRRTETRVPWGPLQCSS
jgi:hypothetical protein